MRRLASRRMRDSCASGGSPGLGLALERLGGHRRRHLARLRAAHAVGDGEERRGEHERVLVDAALAPDVGPARLLDDPQGRVYSWYRYSLSPMRITSATFSRSAARIWRPLR